MAYGPDTEMQHPVNTSGMDSSKWAGALVIGALLFLVAINRGFSGVSVGRLSGGLVRP